MENFGICPYCNIQMAPGGHSSGICNGWYCKNCGHEEPEYGSYSMAGRPPANLSCYCKNCQKKTNKREIIMDDFDDWYEGEWDDIDWYEEEMFYRANPAFITNFDKEEEPLYKTAIYEYGSDTLWIEDSIGYDGDRSLHSIEGDLSKFWRLFEAIEKEIKERE